MDVVYLQTVESSTRSKLIQLMQDILNCDDLSFINFHQHSLTETLEKILDCFKTSFVSDIQMQQLGICSLTVMIQLSSNVELLNLLFESHHFHVKILDIMKICCDQWNTLDSDVYENTVTIKFGLDDETSEFGFLVFSELIRKSKNGASETYVIHFLNEKKYQSIFQTFESHKNNDALTESIHSFLLAVSEIVEITKQKKKKKSINVAENFYNAIFNYLKVRLHENPQDVVLLNFLSKLENVGLTSHLEDSFLNELLKKKHKPVNSPNIMPNHNGKDDYNWHSLFTFMVGFSDNACQQKAACDSLRSGIECNPSLCDLIGEESDCLLPIHNCVILALNIHKKDVYLFQSACGAIYQLSINSKRIQELYVKKGVYMSIIEKILNTPWDDAIQGWGFHALRGLSHDHLFQKELIFTCHIFKHIESILSKIKNISVLKECIGLLACLAQDLETFRKKCIDSGIPVVILGIMIENINNQELVEIVLEALAYFFPYQEEMLLKVADIQSIHNTIKCHQSNEGINLKACVIVQLIAVHKSLINQKDVFNEVVEIIKDAINGFSESCSIQIEGLVALNLLLADCSYGKYEAIITSNVLEILLKIFENSDPMLSSLAKLCLSSLTFEQRIINLVFQRACFYGFKKCFKLMVEWGADFNSSSNEGNALCIAVMNNHIEIVEYLLALKPPNISEALHCALEKNLHDIVGILLCYIGYEEDNRAITWSALNISYLREEYFLPSILQSRKSTRSSSVFLNINLKKESEFSLLCKNKKMLKDQNIIRSVKFLAVSRLPFSDFDPRNLNCSSENLKFDFVKYCDNHANLKKPLVISNSTQAQKITLVQSQFDMDECILNLDISNNQINDLENLAISINLTLNDFFNNLVKLDVSNNELNELSIGFCSLLNSLKSLRASNNNLKQLPYSLLRLQKIVELDVSANHISTIEPEMIPNTTSIKKLDISNNQLTKFPVCFLQKFPFLQHLFLSKNKITALLVSGEFVSLKTLTLSFNQLNKLLSHPIECFVSLEKLDLSHNFLTDLPNYNPQTLLQLSNLNLSHNRLTAKGPFFLPKFILDLPSLIHLDISNNLLTCLPDLHYWSSKKIRELNFSNNDITELPLNKYSKLFWPKISSLIISNNKIKVLPTYIGELSSLCVLDVSNNKQLKTLPDDIGKLVNLYKFPLTGLNLRHGAAVLNGTPRDLVLYFRSKLEKSVPYRCIKLMLVGLAGRGKTSLISQLSKKTHSRNKLATVGIEVRRFVLKPPRLALNRTSSKCPSFSVNAWDFAGQEDFYSTHRYFLSCRALYLAVYNASKGAEELKKLTPWLLNIQTVAPYSKVILVGTHADLCTQESLQSLNAFTKYFLYSSGFPTFHATSIVDCSKENNTIVLLRKEIYKCISKFMFEGKSILEKMVPQSYVKLENFIFDKAKTMHNSGELPILSKNHLHQHSIDHGLRLETAEFNRALMFLTETGSVLNFKDPVHDLKNYIFIDPQWFCQMMARIVTVKEINPYISQRGILSKSNAFKLFPEPCFTQNFLELFFRLLQRFEVLLPISEGKYLVTSKLQSFSPQHLTAAKLGYFEDPNIITRRYDFPHIPIGFWPRLIARILSFPELTRGVRLEKLNLEVDYWHNGVFLNCSQSFCLVTGDEKNLNILDVQSQRSFAGYQLFVGVIDLIDGLVDEWYPGLTDISQERIVKQLVPCHNCKINDKRFTFDLNVCIASSYKADSIKCAECNQFSDIGFIAPDAVFADLGDLVISDWDNKFLDKKYKLGTGAFASVYKVNINGTYFAAKVFNESTGNCPNRMLRQEVDILKRLHHPCLISFFGVSLRPRALLLEYSPLGNLADIIASQKISKNKSLKHKIALQIAEGLAFIHKHNIVYRDLKPSNILVFSYSLSVPVNVKLSDYGISQHRTYQGLIANRGTPTYQAPEVGCEDSEYSIEVDILSYGVTIYELISNGQKPFRDLNHQNEFKDAVLNDKPIDSLISHGVAPWPDIEDLIKNCLRKNPEERPNAETIVNALINIDLLCLKKHVAVCKGQYVDCLTICTYSDSKVEHNEVWAASGGHGLNSQLSWFSIMQAKKQEVQGTMTKIGRILCIMSYMHFIIVGTKEGSVALYDAKAKCFKHKLAQFSDSILCILHTHRFDLFLFGLADGNIAVLTSYGILKPDGSPRYISLNDEKIQNPIICMTQSQDQLICGYGKDIKVLSSSTFDLLQTVSATQRNEKAVSSIIVSQNRLIVSSKKSSRLNVYKYTGNRVDESVLFEFDCSEFLKKVYPNIIEIDCRVVTLELVDNSSLWIGCGGGHVIIVNILKSLFQAATIVSRHLGAVRSIISTPKISGESVSVITGGQGFRPLLASNNDVEEFGFVLIWDANILKLKKHFMAQRKNRDELLTKLSVKTEKFAFPLL
ncbi:leucine-rich repeat serine/threonine-protein kinase 2-like isoform X2 [Hydra vulgaris]|uniref:non-specific serine/threonine protein kinase n=1 Tax=Hydra vulgaris TaxID=6087 RepID=A0ABM4BWF6_HYDVU